MGNRRKALLVGLACAAPGLQGACLGQTEPYEPDAEAVHAFERLVEASRRRAVTTECTLELRLIEGETKSEPQSRKASFTYVPGGDGTIALNEFTCSLNGGMLYAVHDQTDHSYYREEFEGSPYYYLFSNFHDLPFPHLALYWGEPATSDVWMQLHPDTPWIVPTSVGQAPDQEDADLQRLELSSPNGRLQLDYDSRKMLVRAMEHEVTGGHAVQPGVRKVTTYKLEHTVHEDPPDVRFDAGQRQRVDMIVSLMPPPPEPDPAAIERPAGGDLVGKPAPGFVLATTDGGAVDLEQMRGHVVVIDFWATWCKPCVAALPTLHEVAAWARDEELPVTVLAINVWDGPKAPAERVRNIQTFWKDNGFTLPVAVDYSGDTAKEYSVTGIPATFVIRSDGIVHAQHQGAGPQYGQQLRKEISAALEALEADEHEVP